MVSCELFKYLVVAVTPSIFIIGLYVALEQPWMFGVASKGTLATNQFESRSFDEFFYVEGFTALYTILYIYFAISHCKQGDSSKDWDFQGWTFILAIFCNAIIMCLSFVGIGLSATRAITTGNTVDHNAFNGILNDMSPIFSLVVALFPIFYVSFPIAITIIASVTATIEKGVTNLQREWTGVWLMLTRLIPYYLFLPTMIAVSALTGGGVCRAC
jgi:hypothetical protein